MRHFLPAFHDHSHTGHSWPARENVELANCRSKFMLPRHTIKNLLMRINFCKTTLLVLLVRGYRFLWQFEMKIFMWRVQTRSYSNNAESLDHTMHTFCKVYDRTRILKMKDFHFFVKLLLRISDQWGNNTTMDIE